MWYNNWTDNEKKDLQWQKVMNIKDLLMGLNSDQAVKKNLRYPPLIHSNTLPQKWQHKYHKKMVHSRNNPIIGW